MPILILSSLSDRLSLVSGSQIKYQRNERRGSAGTWCFIQLLVNSEQGVNVERNPTTPLKSVKGINLQLTLPVLHPDRHH